MNSEKITELIRIKKRNEEIRLHKIKKRQQQKQYNKMLKERFKDASCNCSICYDNHNKNEMIKINICDHFFGYECLKRWINLGHNNCPYCNQTFKSLIQCTSDNIRYLSIENNDIIEFCNDIRPTIIIEPIRQKYFNNKLINRRNKKDFHSKKDFHN